MRYLSHVLVLSQVQHVKELCIVDMLARTVKNILNRNFSELILENQTEHESLRQECKQKEKEIMLKKKYNHKLNIR